MNGYDVISPGDVLSLKGGLDYVEPGNWVLLSIDGDEVYLSRMGENEDRNFCTTRAIVAVGLADLSLFKPMGLTLDLML